MVSLNNQQLAELHNDIAEHVGGLLVQMALQHSIRASSITLRSAGAIIICINRQAVQTNLKLQTEPG